MHGLFHMVASAYSLPQCLLPSILAGFTTDRLVAQKRSKCGPKPIHLSRKMAPSSLPPLFPSKFIPIFQWEQRHVTKSLPGKKWVVVQGGATKGEDDPLIAGIYCFHRREQVSAPKMDTSLGGRKSAQSTLQVNQQGD